MMQLAFAHNYKSQLTLPPRLEQLTCAALLFHSAAATYSGCWARQLRVVPRQWMVQ